MEENLKTERIVVGLLLLVYVRFGSDWSVPILTQTEIEHDGTVDVYGVVAIRYKDPFPLVIRDLLVMT